MLDTEKEWFIEAPWGRICIMAWGSCADPPVLLCHGGVDSAASWRPLMALLPPRFYYIGMELPGNGLSDPLPPGLMISAHDLVYAIEVVRRHFRWDTFVFMAHSLGTKLGKLYNLSHPGRMSKVVDFDPVPAYFAVRPDQFPGWYDYHFTRYYKKYHIYNAPRETAPKYSREKALAMLEKNRGLTGATASMILDRISEPIGDGLVRFRHDQRTKAVVSPPFTAEHIRQLYSSITTPTLTFLASESVERGAYASAPWLLALARHPQRAHAAVHVPGAHDVHVLRPETLAPRVVHFLLNGVQGLDAKAKL